jgi:hypothetical protein
VEHVARLTHLVCCEGPVPRLAPGADPARLISTEELRTKWGNTFGPVPLELVRREASSRPQGQWAETSQMAARQAILPSTRPI